ncbi:MAG: DNA repair protein RadA [Chitinivibrionales bacterium]|nr:DNA repair protein RadA [Chitinivibrionales bacterium]
MNRKTKTAYVCNECGQEYGKWQGKCTSCGTWDSVVEFKVPKSSSARSRAVARSGGADIVPLAECNPESIQRLTSELADFDRVLGGGLVPGSLTLVGGEPGIGKSTLLLQVLAHWAARSHTVVYVTGEESLEQVSLRARRLGIGDSSVLFLAETNTERICQLFEQRRPHIVVVDSIQTMMCEELESTPGTVTQVRESAGVLMRYAKAHGCAVLLVGHVTKEGAIAGPRLLEHMVDTVLSFEGDANYQYRILRALKNRHGPSGEIALFTMSDRGLAPLANASELFLAGGDDQVGTAVVPVLEGSRVLVVELQALVNRTHYGMPQRVASGINPKRLALLVAVMERHGGIPLGDHDIFFNVAGGLSIAEPAIDLGIIAALISSFRNRPLHRQAFVAEIGLGGELRPVNNMQARITELLRTGYRTIVVPPAHRANEWASKRADCELRHCARITDVLRVLFA